MLVKGDEFAQGFRREPLGKNRVRWPIAFEDSVWREPIRRALGLHLLKRLTESERLGLSEDIRHENVVMPAERIERFGECDEVARNEPGPLMDQLVERVLPVRSRLSPVDGAGLEVVVGSVGRDMLALALRRLLVQVRWLAL